MEKTVSYVLSAGIYQHTRDYYFWMVRKENYKNEEKYPKVISIHDLKFLFTIWMVTLGMSTIIFIAEFLAKFIEKIIKSFIGLIFMLKSVKKL